MIESDVERGTVEIHRRGQSAALRRFAGPLALVLLTLALAAPFFDVPMQRDQGVYAACGSILFHGGVPYRDCWDTKAPMTHYTYALAQLLFGIDLRGPVILSAFIAGLTAIVLWRIARRWFDDWLAWAVGLVYAWLVVSIPFDMNAQSEGFANLFIALGVWSVIEGIERDSRWRLFGAGAAFAVAVAYKYTIVLPAGIAVSGIFLADGRPPGLPRPALSPTPGAARQAQGQVRASGVAGASRARLSSFRHLLPAAAGFLAAFALFTAYLSMRGGLGFALEHMVFMLTEFPKVVVNPTLLLFPNESGPPLFYLQRTWYQFLRLPVFHLLGLAGCAIAFVRKRPWGRLAALWLIASLISVYPQKVMTLYHWTLSLLPLTLGTGALVWEFRSRRWIVAAACLGVIANLGVRVYADQWLVSARYLTGQQTKSEFYASQAVQDEIEVAEYIRDRTTPDDLIWVWGNHSIMYYWSDRRSPTRFIFNSPLMAQIGPNDFQPRWKHEVLEALSQRPPTYIVVTYYDRTWFDYENPVEQFGKIEGYQQFLDRYYRKEAFIGRFALYRLTPWWSRLNPPDLLDAATAVDLLSDLDQAELESAPNQPIQVRDFKLYDEASFPALLVHPEGRATFRLALPEGAVCFRADLAMDPQSWGWGGDGATFGLAVNGEKVFERYLGNAVTDRFWQPVIVDLSKWAGQPVSLTLYTGPGPTGDFTGDLAGWGVPRLVVPPGGGSSCQVRAIVQ